MEKFYDYRKLQEFAKEIPIMIRKCWARPKTKLYECLHCMNFKTEKSTSMELIMSISKRCYECCGDCKCSSYYDFMKEAGKLYREQRGY